MTAALRDVDHADGSMSSSQEDAPAPAPAIANPARTRKTK